MIITSGYQSDNWPESYNVSDPGQVAAGYGVPHISELSAIWGPNNTQGFSPPSYLSINRPIIPIVQGYWTSFIRAFNPNSYRARGTPEWQTFGSIGTRMLFEVNNTRLETVPDDQKERCAYISSIALDIQQWSLCWYLDWENCSSFQIREIRVLCVLFNF